MCFSVGEVRGTVKHAIDVCSVDTKISAIKPNIQFLNQECYVKTSLAWKIYNTEYEIENFHVGIF